VVAYLRDVGTAEAATFTPSAAQDALDVRRDTIVSGFASLTDPVLLPRPEGGLQALISGIQSASLYGTLFAPRNSDGTFGAPAVATTASTATAGNPAVLAPDGLSVWPSSYAGGLHLWRGSTGPATVDLGRLKVQGSQGVYAPAIGRDAQGRYWLAWYELARSKTAAGIYVVPFDPVSLQPTAPAQRAPGSAEAPGNGLRLTFPCAAACRLVYVQTDNRVVSWAYGEQRAAEVALVPRARISGLLGAAFTAKGRLWVAWWDRVAARFTAKLGNASGAGGTPVSLAHPPGGRTQVAGHLAAASVGEELVLVVNWGVGGFFFRYVNVVSGG
jgi:hypothetical protein